MNEDMKSILVVEDHSVASMIAKKILESLDCEVDIASDGAKAIELINSNKRYDAIYMDIGLPDTSGVELCKYIREKERNECREAVPIIAVTSNVDNEEICLKSGMNELIAKPFTKEKALKLLSYCNKQ